MLKKLFLFLFIFMFSAFNGYAQEASTQNEAGQATVETITKSQDGIVSLEFREADIRNVLRILSFKSGVNIVAGPEVTGLVSIELRDVPWKRALEVILSTYGYAYEQKDNIILVTTVENLKKRREDALLLAEQEPLVTQTFILNYAKAADTIESIEKMKTARGSVNYDERTNALIVRDIASNVELIGAVIDTLDTVTPQVLIEAKIVETTLSDTENLGIDWVAKATLSGAKRPSLYPFTASSNNKYLGNADFPAPDEEEFTYGTIDFSQVQATLELLRSRTNTNILSNPRIITLDNKSAVIQVGVEHPIPTFGVNEETAQLQATSIEYRNIGINFTVTPHVNNAGFITFDIVPEVSEVAGTVVFDTIDVPLISTEKASTNVMIKDGETLVIAGLIKDQVTETQKKIPFLGDIPLIGLAFRKTENRITKTDLLIFLTPHIVTADFDE